MNEGNLLERVKALKLYGLIEHWDEVCHTDWLKYFIDWEEKARSQRSYERRLHAASLGKFKLLDEFDWSWPVRCDKEIIIECTQLDFLKKAINIVLCGSNGVGKSTIAKNIAYQAVLSGYSALFVTAGKMLNNLAAQTNDENLQRRIKYYVKPDLLVIDEVGYLSYSNRHADLMFEVVSQRYQEKSIIITTNKPFAEWGEMFPNVSCVVSMIDRLIHLSEFITIEAESYRLKEAKERSLAKKEKGQTKKKNNPL